MKQIATIPLKKIAAIRIYINAGHKTLEKIKQETGADYMINGGLFNPDWTPCAILKAEGRMRSGAPWRDWGFGWDQGPDIRLTNDWDSAQNFLSCITLLRGREAQDVSALRALGGSRQRSAIGLKKDAVVLYCTDEGTTPEQLQETMEDAGCTDAIMLDGGGSSQCDFQGRKIRSKRVVQNLILIHTAKEKEEKEDSMGTKKTVCLDAGHGNGSVNCSPDRRYWEHEFAFDTACRVRKLLEARGIRVVMARENDTDKEKGSAGYPTLTQRAQVSNRAYADLFISFHSNAAAGGWSNARGMTVYTSAPGGERNRMASLVIRNAREAGIAVRPYPIKHYGWTVLVKSKAPAVLIEHGFHTNREDVALLSSSAYRDKLAEVDAKAACEFLGVPWKAEKTDRERVQERFELADSTMDYLEAYTYGKDLLHKLATER